jgi:hypothetical protein
MLQLLLLLLLMLLSPPTPTPVDGGATAGCAVEDARCHDRWNFQRRGHELLLL